MTSSTIRLGADAIAAGIASRQHGVVTRAQLLEAGLTSRQVWSRVQSGWLRVVHRGVYLVGPVESARAREMAAVLACGPGAVLSHWSAAWLLDLVRRPAGSPPVHLTVRGPTPRRRPGLRCHRATTLSDDEVTTSDAIPITTPARTLLDLAGDRGGFGSEPRRNGAPAAPNRRRAARALEQAVSRAERKGLVTLEALATLVARHRGRAGAAVLGRLLGQAGGPVMTRSEAEERLLERVRSGGLPAPELNTVVAGWEVDFLWRAERVAVEVDSIEFHSSPRQIDADRRRDADLNAEGLRVIRLGWRQIVETPDRTLVMLTRVLMGHPAP